MNIGIAMIAGNTADTLDVFFQWAVSRFPEVVVLVQPENFDDTKELCSKWEKSNPDIIRVQVHEFDDFSSQKQRAIDMCTKEWCILMDADEILADFPYEQIPHIMERMKANLGYLPRYNLQRDINHYNADGYPDYQARILKTNSGVMMNGKTVDESLVDSHNGQTAVLDMIPILHLGHIRPTESLKQKGRDRIKFADEDRADGRQLKEVGTDWFIARNRAWDENAKPLPKHHAAWVKRYAHGTVYEGKQ